MRSRLALALSATALVVAVLGSTSLGHAAMDALVPVPLAKRAYLADTAKNAVRLNNIKANRTPTAGMLVPLGADGKFPTATGAIGPQGPQGVKGPAGPSGISGYEVVGLASPTSNGYKNLSASAKCPDGKKMLGGGGYVSPSGEPAAIYASWPDTGRNQWTVSARQYAADTQTYWGLYVFAICAKVAS